MGHARLAVELGGLAGALGGCLAAGALYAIGRRRVRALTALLAQLDRDLEVAAAALVALQRVAANVQASGDAMPPAGETLTSPVASSGERGSRS